MICVVRGSVFFLFLLFGAFSGSALLREAAKNKNRTTEHTEQQEREETEARISRKRTKKSGRRI
ncbi:MAG: hypothetical protein DMF63_15110 [Acidobacteria bacterium]|nr:MAG: hypothetical protein DMF63_15110 [Acidobacteriota bacterium]